MSEQAPEPSERLSRGKLNKLGKGVVMFALATQQKKAAEQQFEKSRALLAEFIPEIVGTLVPMTGEYRYTLINLNRKYPDQPQHWHTVRQSTTAEDTTHVLPADYWLVCGIHYDNERLIVAHEDQQLEKRYLVDIASIQLADREMIRQAHLADKK